MIGIWQLVLILVIVLVLFGAGRVPRIMKDLGLGLRAFKDGLDQDDCETNENRDVNVSAGKLQVSSEKKKSKSNVAHTSGRGTKKKSK